MEGLMINSITTTNTIAKCAALLSTTKNHVDGDARRKRGFKAALRRIAAVAARRNIVGMALRSSFYFSGVFAVRKIW
jgi:hypothetical protein